MSILSDGMLSTQELNALGDSLNTFWGKQSTERGKFPLGGASPASLTLQLASDVGPQLSLPPDVIKKKRVPADNDGKHLLIVRYTDFVTFRSTQEAQAQVRQFRKIAEEVVAGRTKALKSDFKLKSSRALKIKLREAHDSVEPMYSPTPEVSLVARPAGRPATWRGYYRYIAVYEVA